MQCFEILGGGGNFPSAPWLRAWCSHFFSMRATIKWTSQNDLPTTMFCKKPSTKKSWTF